MAATNYTPIQLYHSTTASAVPVNTNLVNGELAINIADGKLYYKDSGGTVQVIATKATGTIGGSDTQVQYNSSGALAGSSNFTFNGTTATINTLNLTNALGATYGGTAQSSWTTGDLLYASGSNTLAKLGIGLNTYILTSNGTIPGWAAPSAISVNTATNLAGGAAGSVPYQSGAGATTFLSIGTANQVVTSTGSAPQWSSGLSITTLTASDAVTFSATTQNIALGTSQTSGTFTVGGTAQTGNIAIDRSTKTHTLNIGTGITESGQTKTINIGTAGDTGSTTAIAIGSTNGTTITLNGTVNAATVNVTTLDLTNLEVTNIKAKDGTAAMSIADSTGVVSITANPVLSGGTANGVLYLNGSKVATSGSALTFDGTDLTNKGKIISGGVLVGNGYFQLNRTDAANLGSIQWLTSGDEMRYSNNNGGFHSWYIGTEKLRITYGGQVNIGGNFTSTNNTLQVTGNAAIGYTTAAPTTGLIVAGNVGIGTDSPIARLTVSDSTVTNGTMTLGNNASYNGTLQYIFSTGELRISQVGAASLGTTLYTAGSERVRVENGGNFLLRQSSNAANTSVSFNTTVQNALTLDSSGNLGVGTGSPGYRLDARSDTAGAQYRFGTSDNYAYLLFGQTSGVTQLTSAGYANAAFAISVGGSERTRILSTGQIQWSPDGTTQAMTLNASGNLGIGETNPGWKLQVNGSAGVQINNANAAEFHVNNTSTSARDWVFISSGSAWAGGGQTGYFNIYDNTASAQRLTIDTSGNLGIGTTSPLYKFDVRGPATTGVAAPVSLVSIPDTNGNRGGFSVWNASGGALAGITAQQIAGGNYPNSIGRLDVWVQNGAGTTTAATFDASGNLGLGVTPSAWGSSFKALQFAGGSVAAGSDRIWMYQNVYINSSGQETYVANAPATAYRQYNGLHYWYTAAASTGNISFTQAMTLDASGNLAVGTPNPNAYASTTTFTINGTTYSEIDFEVGGTLQGYINGVSGGLEITADGSRFIKLRTENTERARITSGGYFKASNDGTYLNAAGTYHEINQTANDNILFIRSTDTAYSVDGVQLRFSRNTTNNSFYVLSYYNATAAAYKFRVADSGDVTNTNGSYGTISDAKMKTDIVDAGSQWSDIKAIRFRKFKMKDDPSGLAQLGVVAQEVEQTSPGLVDEHIDRDSEGNDLGTTTKSVKTSVLLMKAAVALQEAMARIEKLEAEMAALKGA